MNEGPARSSTCESAPHACRCHALLGRCHRGNSVGGHAGVEGWGRWGRGGGEAGRARARCAARGQGAMRGERVSHSSARPRPRATQRPNRRPPNRRPPSPTRQVRQQRLEQARRGQRLGPRSSGVHVVQEVVQVPNRYADQVGHDVVPEHQVERSEGERQVEGLRAAVGRWTQRLGRLGRLVGYWRGYRWGGVMPGW
jgi:hypothetical protein